MITPNPLAYLMLAIWPYVVWRLYHRLDAGRALIWTVLGAYMFLPPLTVFSLPMIPDLDKDTLPALSATMITYFLLRRRLTLWPEGWVGRVLLVLFVAAPFVTVLTNPDPIPISRAPDIPGMRIYDSLSTVAMQILYLLPMFLARRDLASRKAIRDLLAALVLAGLIYSLPMMFESRFSPQLNIWVYGYFQHDFAQAHRFGGFRPFVFMPHGLWLALFALMCLLASAFFLRQGPAERRPKQLLAFLWLALALYICKSFGPGAYAMAGLPLILFMPARLQIWVAALVAVIVMIYPLLRGAHLVPLQQILDFAYDLSHERGWSLEFRIRNEEVLLARAAERPLFGWGGYARNLIHDPVTGRAVTIPDGQWVIVIGSYGWLGYLAQFGLLCLPLWALARESLRWGAVISREVAVLALILGFNLADLLPNATLVPLTWLMAGALWGQAEELARARRTAREARRKGLTGQAPAMAEPRTIL